MDNIQVTCMNLVLCMVSYIRNERTEGQSIFQHLIFFTFILIVSFVVKLLQGKGSYRCYEIEKIKLRMETRQVFNNITFNVSLTIYEIHCCKYKIMVIYEFFKSNI